MKKLVFLIVTFLFSVHNTYAQTDFSDFRNKAENFILSESENPAWKWYSPIITKETPFYSGNDDIPSYIEYKVSCSDMYDCWWIMVNTDKSDTSIPIASFAGWTMSETLNPKNENNFKYYYFGILDYYAVNKSTWKLVNITQNWELTNNPSNIYYRDNNPLTKSFNTLKRNSKENLETHQKFRQNQKEETTFSARSFSARTMPKYIWNFQRTTKCSSYTPCYNQWRRSYPEGNWATGCTPAATSIILWHYDRNWFPNIFSFEAPLSHDNQITNIQTTLWHLMWTYYVNWEGSTPTSRNMDWWKILNKKYNYTADYHSWWNLIDNIQDEINNWRPAMLSIGKYENGKRIS